jgi:hypothetical protein
VGTYIASKGITTVSQGFLRNPDGDITLFDAPNAFETFAFCINARGDVAGEFVDAGFRQHSFVRDHKGDFVVFDAQNGGGSASGPAINARGEIAGSFYEGGRLRGYLRDEKGNFTIFDTPRNTGPWVTDINASGDVAGFHQSPQFRTQAREVRLVLGHAERASCFVRLRIMTAVTSELVDFR